MEKTLDNFVIKSSTKKAPGKRKSNEEDTPKTSKSKKVAKEESEELVADAKNTISTLSAGDIFSSVQCFTSKLSTWLDPLKDYLSSQKMTQIFNFCKNEYNARKIYPPRELIFNAFCLTSWDNTKVVIIGQDPYINDGEAMGLSFSVPKGKKIPPSLDNIYKCIQNDKNCKFKNPSHGDLTSWAEQGVLLLNATLTVIEKKANSHQKDSGWEDFTNHVIKKISDLKKGIVFLLWGSFAIKKKKLINGSKHHIIECSHPSPMSENKLKTFCVSKQFSQANELLQKEGMDPIEWQN
jgi:uracil-DNA glycosylase